MIHNEEVTGQGRNNIVGEFIMVDRKWCEKMVVLMEELQGIQAPVREELAVRIRNEKTYSETTRELGAMIFENPEAAEEILRKELKAA